MANNSELQIRLRKNQNTLVVIGWGVIAFGVWSALKVVLYSALSTDSTRTSLNGRTEVVVFWILIGIVLALDLCLRLYVGLSAVKEGRGVKKRKAYIVLAFLMAFISFMSFVLGPLALRGGESVGSVLVSSVVEATSCTMLVEMALSAIKVKRLTRAIEEQEG